MRVLVLDSALARCAAALIAGDEVVAIRSMELKQGHQTVLPVMARDAMKEAGGAPELVAVTVGPGSFTGIRAGLALGHGIGLALDVPVVGVTVGEAIADSFPHLGERELWIVTDSRRGHIFLENGATTISLAWEALPFPTRQVAIAGGAANRAAAHLAARGADVMLTDARFPLARHIAQVALRRWSGTIRALAAQPLYVDPPEASVPRGGLRPPPEAVSG
jgi:tRNA threonylcarbamoyl adenosine modification protein YeaZ